MVLPGIFPKDGISLMMDNSQQHRAAPTCLFLSKWLSGPCVFVPPTSSSSSSIYFSFSLCFYWSLFHPDTICKHPGEAWLKAREEASNSSCISKQRGWMWNTAVHNELINQPLHPNCIFECIAVVTRRVSLLFLQFPSACSVISTEFVNSSQSLLVSHLNLFHRCTPHFHAGCRCITSSQTKARPIRRPAQSVSVCVCVSS